MGENTLGIGKMASSMAVESTICTMVRKKSASGFRARRSSGLRRIWHQKNDD
jgi:hypothetical protein